MALGSRPFDSDHVPVFLDPSVMCMLGGWRGILRTDSAGVTGHIQQSTGVCFCQTTLQLCPLSKAFDTGGDGKGRTAS